ncbi:MAG TPA: hypothetical protein VHL32_03875 [Gemmatimonadaceae bacterium]|jgi:hypothetical protein|nr:hypothetical protein [Gemmatimonadaceae bacterium]
MSKATTVIGLIAVVAVAAISARTYASSHSADTSAAADSTATAANVVQVVGEDFRFEAPDVIPAGLTEFKFLNKGPALHHMSLVKLNEGKTVDDLRAALANPGPPPKWMQEMGGPNAPVPGGEANATINLEPGNYALICFVDIDGPPHFTKGMVRALKVEPAKAPSAKTVKADTKLDLLDYNFKLSSPITAGTRTIEVHNSGPQVHEIELVQLAPGVTPADFMKWMGKMEGPPPGKALGGIAGMAPGLTEYFSADFAPGNYLLLCFVPDAKDGKPHFAHGMMQEITVK